MRISEIISILSAAILHIPYFKSLSNFFEFKGNKLKLKDNVAYDPVDENLKTITGASEDMFYTQGNWLNEIQFVGYETSDDLAAGSNHTFLAGVDVTSLFKNVDPVPLKYYSASPGDKIKLAGNNKIDALLPKNDAGTASVFVTGPSGPPYTRCSANRICISVNLFGNPMIDNLR